MTRKNMLIIGLVWPEPTSSAAGTRMIQLVTLFLSNEYNITFASAASKSDFSFDLPSIGVKEQVIVLNDPSFNNFLKELMPDIVLFDRFMIEEQYGWRLHQECPDALRILDTEDLHFLRNARQHAIKTNNISLSPADLFTDLAKREIAAILRCDVSLIISETEMEILQNYFQVDPSLIHYLPFLEDELTEATTKNWKKFEQREGFVFIGNYLHEPNWDTLQILKTKIWPILRVKLPKAVMHIYGAYISQKVAQLHNAKENFLIHGRADNAKNAIETHRVLIAPIQFGAGVKGKFIDAMQTGTPTVTTTVGAEAMMGDLAWCGAIEDEPENFINEAVQLYEDKNRWSEAQQNGMRIINRRYGKSSFIPAFIDTINRLSINLKLHRQQNFFGQILQYHTANSTRYMSLWIEEKNKHK